MDAGEHVEQRAIGGRGEPHTIGRHHGDAECPGQLRQRGVVRFLIPQEMPLQLYAHMVAPEQADEPIDHPAHAVLPRVEDRAARQRDEAGSQSVELLENERAFPLGRAHLHAGDQAA